MKTAEYLKALGQIALEFGNLEWLLDNLYVGLNCDFQSRENAPTDFDSISKRLNLIGFRIEKKYPARMKDWHELEWTVRKLAKEREAVLLSALPQQDSADVFITRGESRDYSVAELLDLAKRTAETNRRITEFATSLRA
jgi:hypothetical protein